MTTGVPIYLVSACASGEEFVAAFRRYSDRGSLFVPIAEPLPPGRRGRIAVTLANGGVMLDGDVEIVSSSKAASILHGRIGMTLRFVDPDEPTKTLLVELDRARLSVRPNKPSVSPRPAQLPAAPRPVPPPTSGRIDAANALAECVSIGDLGTLREGSPPLKPGQKFAMPSIPGAGAKVPNVPPRLNIAPAEPVPVPAPVAPSRPFRLPTPPPAAELDDGQAAQIYERPPRNMPTNGTQPSAIVPMPRAGQNQTLRGTKPPPLDKPVVTRTSPLPLPVAPRPPTARVVPEEPIDLADVRSTAIGVGVPPPHDTTLMDAPPSPAMVGSLRVDAQAPTVIGEPPQRAEASADGDWTMAPDDPAPMPRPPDRPPGPPPGPMTGNWTIALTPEGWGEPEKVAASLPAPGPPTAVSGETGLSASSVANGTSVGDESKIQVDPTLMEPLIPMPLDDEPPVPMRPTPMPLPPAPSRATPYPPMLAPATPVHATYPPPPPPPLIPPPPLNGTGSNAVFHETRLFEEAHASQSMAQDPTSLLDISRRRRLIVIISSALAIALLGIVLVVVVGGRNKDGKDKPAEGAVDDRPIPIEHTVAPPVTLPPDAAGAIAEAPDAAAAAAVAPVDATPPPTADCSVEIVTAPKDVEIAIDNTTKIGTAPGTVQLPCGTEVKLYLRKPGFAGVIKAITPTADMKPVRVVLVRAQFTVKVSSTPAGATISIGGKPMGVTPTVVHLNGFEPVALQLAKDGYAPQEQRLTPKQQNQVVHVKLTPKKKSR